MASSQSNNYAPVFVDGGDQYVLIQTLTTGHEGQAQLVWHIQSREYRVRKIFRSAQPLQVARDNLEITFLQSLNRPLDRIRFRRWYENVFVPEAERRLVQAMAARDPSVVNPVTGGLTREQNDEWEALIYAQLGRTADEIRDQMTPEPHIVTLHVNSVNALPTVVNPATQEAEERQYLAVMYLPFYNGGDLQRISRSAGAVEPTSVRLRWIAQMARALDYIYKPPVNIVHWDLHEGNIFIHYPSGSTDTAPDFYMGDFGLAEVANADDDPTGQTRTRDIQFLLDSLRYVYVRDMEPVTRAIDELTHIIDNWATILSTQVLPDMRTFLGLIEQAATENPVTAGDLAQLRGPVEIRGPTYYDNVDDCSTQNILGSFQVGRVTVDTAGGIQHVENISDEVYCGTYEVTYEHADN